jgi:hypothetical protein
MSSARALSAGEIAALEAEEPDAVDQFTRIRGKTYLTEDVAFCSGCNDATPHPADLDDESLCEDCAEEALDADEDLEELAADWRSDRGCSDY